MSLHFSTVDTPAAALPGPVIAVETAQANIPVADEDLPHTLNELRRLAEYAVKHGLRVDWE
jgi:hypothetical protein